VAQEPVDHQAEPGPLPAASTNIANRCGGMRSRWCCPTVLQQWTCGQGLLSSWPTAQPSWLHPTLENIALVQPVHSAQCTVHCTLHYGLRGFRGQSPHPRAHCALIHCSSGETVLAHSSLAGKKQQAQQQKLIGSCFPHRQQSAERSKKASLNLPPQSNVVDFNALYKSFPGTRNPREPILPGLPLPGRRPGREYNIFFGN
jgi:hypothetical protein